jgi:MFS transporter, DHA1 family, multidrug resistance protein
VVGVSLAARSGPARPGYRWLALLLAALSMIGPFSIDTYLPSFPDIARSLDANQLQVQQSLTAYLAPFALMMLWHGALSDALGRRPVILWGLALYALASAGCIFVVRIEQLWLLRAAQGVTAGVGMVVGRAIIRDLFDGAEAQRLMGHIGMVFAVAPAIAPIIGGLLQSAFGWRSVFVLLAILAAALWLACWRFLPETLPGERRQSLHPVHLSRAYYAVLTDPLFLTASAAIALNFGGMFIYVLSAPVFVIQHLGLSSEQFGYLFVPAMVGLMSGSFLASRWAAASPFASIRRGFALMAAAAALNLIFCNTGLPALPWAVAAMPLYTCGMAVAMPGLTLLALDRFPLRRGLAASCQGFIHTGGNAVVAGLLAPLLWGSTVSLAAGMVALLALGALALLLHIRLHPPV